jgi:hypothetical protein
MMKNIMATESTEEHGKKKYLPPTSLPAHRRGGAVNGIAAAAIGNFSVFFRGFRGHSIDIQATNIPGARLQG